MPQCNAKTLKGKRCKAASLKGGKKCLFHSRSVRIGTNLAIMGTSTIIQKKYGVKVPRTRKSRARAQLPGPEVFDLLGGLSS